MKKRRFSEIGHGLLSEKMNYCIFKSTASFSNSIIPAGYDVKKSKSGVHSNFRSPSNWVGAIIFRGWAPRKHCYSSGIQLHHQGPLVGSGPLVADPSVKVFNWNSKGTSAKFCSTILSFVLMSLTFTLERLKRFPTKQAFIHSRHCLWQDRSLRLYTFIYHLFRHISKEGTVTHFLSSGT